MDRFKFQAFLEEFPFLAEVNKKENRNQRDYHNCSGITVKRATIELLAQVPSYDGASGSLVGIDNGQRFDFVLEDGTVIRDAVQDQGYCHHNEAYTENESWSGETVLEAIDKHNVADRLSFIVRLDYGYDIRDHYSGPEYRIVIFKTSREFTFDTLIAEAKTKALKEVKAEANF